MSDVSVAEKESVTIRFWGVRGSYPAPGDQTVRYGGNTACVEVCFPEHTIILDAGTGIIPLGRDLARRSLQAERPINAVLLFSHMHHDHTQGFPFFLPAFMLSTRLHIFGPHTFERDLEQVLAHNMAPPVFPVTLRDMSASKDIQSLGENQVVLLPGGELEPGLAAAVGAECGKTTENVCIRVMRSYAHPGGVLVYRIDWRGISVVYATDTEGYANIDRRLVEFARGADLMIHDAQYTEEHYLGLAPGVHATQGWGHSTAAMACEVAQAAGAKQLALFHYDPGYSDQVVERIEASARQQFPGAFAPREGMEVNLRYNQRAA